MDKIDKYISENLHKVTVVFISITAILASTLFLYLNPVVS